MNTANLQLEGLYLIMASLNNALVNKGLITREELDAILRAAEETVINDYAMAEMSPANRDAVAFPARLLRLANNGASGNEIQPFSELAKLVAQTKAPYNDQR